MKDRKELLGNSRKFTLYGKCGKGGGEVNPRGEGVRKAAVENTVFSRG